MRYSQNNEETIILDYFGSYIGRFIDIGANDGVTLSNTRALINRGWNGYMIEPCKDAYNRLMSNCEGNKVKCLNYAVNVETKPIDLYVNGSHMGDDVGLLSTIIPSETERWKGEDFVVEKVMSYSFADMCQMEGILNIDFINIDAEGMDYDILKQINIKKMGVKMICVESNSIDDYKYASLLEPFDMLLKYKSAENLIYAL